MTIPDPGSLMNNEDIRLPYTPEEEKRIIKELRDAAESDLKQGNLYYLVSNRWWRKWQEYTEQDESNCPIDEHCTSSQHSNGSLSKIPHRPGQIDNSDLLVNGMDGEGDELEIRVMMEEEHDYVLVPQEAWKKLLEWYKGGPALPREMISQGFHHKGFSVEVYPLRLQLIDAKDDSRSIFHISKRASVRELYNRVCKLFRLEGNLEGKVRIWDYFNKRKYALLDNFDQTLEEAQMQMDQYILLEVQHYEVWPSGFGTDSTGNELALVPIEPTRSSISIAGGPTLSNAGGPTLSNGSSTGYGPDLFQESVLTSALRDTEDVYELSSTHTRGDGGGLTGLQNLGNTCFMNSALQCLVHTPPLVEYFLEDYSEEINKQNPLGLKGELAVAFGDLLRKLWSSGRTPIAPRAFKGKLARFAPQFSGYNQHDSQELLAFLLDGLHEDLNRVKEKPYIEAKDSGARPDNVVADECWANHKARNDSIIVDVCQGQYKSTLVCPDCSKVSVTFDPFMYLSLPLPSMVTRTMTVTVFYGDGSALPMPFTVTVLKQSYCKDLSQALSTACCLKADETLLLAEVYDHRIYRYLENPSESLSGIKDDDHIVAYRLPANHLKLPRLEIIHRKKEMDLQSSGFRELMGTPLVSYLEEGAQSVHDIQAHISAMLAPLSRKKALLSLDRIKTSKENGCGLGVDADRVIDNCYRSPSPMDPSISNTELEHLPNGESTVQLWLTDDKCLSKTPLENCSLIMSGPIIRVLVEWSSREHELYDASFLEDLPEVFKPGFTVKKTRQEAISLFSCLEAFLKEEPLGPDDMWYCPTCKEHRQASKKLDLWRLPDILVFHLKRFSYSRFLKNKLDTFVNFPLHNLDLGKYVKHEGAPPQSHVYELYAVSNHYGGLGGGHYAAYAKLIEDNKWYHFDDNHVSPIGKDAIKTSAAYVLFYRRIEVRPGMEVGESSWSGSPSS
ncbi:ubiquitin carboxyl-terminal hydrolase 10-like [Tasmannia lanceolata]|uniref:ubiquitin carboxyl-terminal hydrolase 10-like n=1 Tax=Tasmannia lanceolata TaxID=3420 RepID=UPI004063C647